MKINIGTKGMVEGVSYIRPVRELSVKGSEEDTMLFMVNSLKEEVLAGTDVQQIRKAKKLKKLVRGLTIVLAASIQMAPRAFAATVETTGGGITPDQILEWGRSLAAISVSAGIAMSMVMLGVAGILRMMNKRDMATNLTTDIIKGLVQVLVSVPTVLILFYLAQYMFKNLPALGSLF